MIFRKDDNWKREDTVCKTFKQQGFDKFRTILGNGNQEMFCSIFKSLFLRITMNANANRGGEGRKMC